VLVPAGASSHSYEPLPKQALRMGRAVIWFGLTWNLEDYFQLIRRIWRRGVADRVVNHHISARDTTDVALLSALGAKHRTEKALLDALRDYRKGR
jgi:ABC-type Zn uptake system ZnuABC Zn-binding protein ZnuA